MPVSTFDSYALLPAGAGNLFAEPGSGDLLRSQQWLQNAQDYGLRPGDRARIYAVEATPGVPQTLLPAVYSRLYATHAGSRVLHFLYPEDQAFSPLGAPDEAQAVSSFASVISELQRDGKGYDVIRVSPLLAGAPFAASVIGTLRGSGHFVQPYLYPAERYQSVQAMSFKQYLAGRPRPLRESLERNTRLLLHGGRGHFHLARNRDLLEEVWGDIRKLVETTPEEGEPESPDYLPSMLMLAAEFGQLRLGMFYLDDVPVAMQFWIVNSGVAHCLRLWGCQSQQVFPIDDLLTQMIAVCLIDGDRVSELNFGAIDVAYCGDWATDERARFGVAAFNSRTWRGLRGALRHVALPRLKSAPARLWRRLAGRPQAA